MDSHSFDRIKMPSGFWDGLRLAGTSANDVVSKAGLPISIITDPFVTTDQYFALWQDYSDLIGDTAEGIIQLATAFETSKYPPNVLAPYHARNYRDALYRMARYKQMCPPENMRINEGSRNCTIELDWLHAGEAGPQLLIGITMAFLLELGRRGTGLALKARHVEFTRPMGNVQTLEAFFGCRIRSGADVNRITLHRSDLDLTLLSYNKELLEVLSPALERSLSERQDTRSIPDAVKWIIKRNLTAGRPDIRTVAKELGMSDRSLQRRLSEENTNFKQLVTQARHEQALEYLADPSLEISEVAFLIGYEDQNSFYRAFRLWEGETPSNWRSGHLERAIP